VTGYSACRSLLNPEIADAAPSLSHISKRSLGFTARRHCGNKTHTGTSLIDRRYFLKTGLMAVGSALGCSLLSCDSELEIPCLGPAQAPVPVAGMTYIRASEIGCALDCDLRNGRNKYTGGAATDDGPRINAAMAGATANNPITLIIDGSALISGLFLPAGGYWNIAGLGCGTGFFVKSGTNNDGMHNGPPSADIPSDPGPPAPARGRNVSLRNFTVNGNQGNGFHGNSTSGTRQGGDVWYSGINLKNLDNIIIEKVVVVNTPAFHIQLSNVGDVSISGCVMKSHGLSTDGLHFDGPANDITISNCDFTTGDDSIALNCPEGYSGNISRVAVTNCTFNSLSLMRLYTTNGGPNKFSIDTVSVSNCTGTLSEAAFLIGVTNGSSPDSVASLAISDCSLVAPAVLAIAENFGTIALKNVTFVPSVSNVVWVSPQTNHICGFLRPSPLYGGVTYVGSSLSFENCQIYRNPDIQVAAVVLESDSTIENLTFNGFGLQEAASSSPMPNLLEIGSASIGQLVFESLDSKDIYAPISAGGFLTVGSISGAGVLATGWEFPDAVMANGVPYISASSGLPSIKIGGVVQPYTEP
jgi:Glycosyl hydrolases family 28